MTTSSLQTSSVNCQICDDGSRRARHRVIAWKWYRTLPT